MSGRTDNALILIQLLTQLLAQAQSIGQLVSKARSEGRDVTDAELAALMAQDDAVRAALEAEIVRQQSR